MALTPITTPMTSLELAQKINDNMTDLDTRKADASDLASYIPNAQKAVANGVATLNASNQVVQKALSAVTADDYNTASGAIKTKFDSEDSEIANIKNGNTIVGKARDLSPLTAPGNSKLYGTSPSGVVGWYDQPAVQTGGYTGPHTEPFTATDSRWGAPVSGVYSLTIPHGGSYPFAVFRQDGAVYSVVSVDIQRDNNNIIIRSMAQFAGYVGMV